MPQRLLTGIAHRQVQAHGGDDEHQPGGEQMDAVVFEIRGRHDQRHQQGQANPQMDFFHTLRSSLRPSKPWGLNKITTMKMIKATASL